jgi:malate permease and related proteins
VDLCFLQHWFSGLLACQLHIYEDYESRGKKQGVWQLAGTFSNIGYMGFPVIGAMFGANGLFLATFANIAYNLFYFSIGVVMISRGKGKAHFNWRSVLFNNIMAVQYGGDAEFAAKSTTLSSILCLVTTPFIFMLI